MLSFSNLMWVRDSNWRQRSGVGPLFFKFLRSGPFLIFLPVLGSIQRLNGWRCPRFSWRIRNLTRLSLETQCPHILRALLSLVRTLEGYKRPLAHPSKGLDLQFILDIAHSKEPSVALSMIVQGLPHTGCLAFPGICGALDTFSELHADIVALLGYDHSNQVVVVEKIQAFVGRMAHRSVADMLRTHHEEELALMWYNADNTEQEREKCEEVSYILLKTLTTNKWRSMESRATNTTKRKRINTEQWNNEEEEELSAMEVGHGIGTPFHGFAHKTRGYRSHYPRQWAPSALCKGT